MTFRIVFVPDAREQLRYYVGWWRENRSAAKPLTTLVRRALQVIATSPGLGTISDHPTVRFMRIAGTPYALFYETHPADQKIRVVAVWSLARGKGPPL